MRRARLAVALVAASLTLGAVPSSKRARRSIPGLSAPTAARVVENTSACAIVPMYGQSSSRGVCSGECDAWGVDCNRTGASAYCSPVTTTPVANAYFAAWNGATQTYDNGVCALDEDQALCARDVALESPAAGLVETYMALRGAGPAVFTCTPGTPGTSIAQLSSPSAEYSRLLACITEIRDTVAADPDPATNYGCDGTVIVRGMGMVQGESDDVVGNTTYATEVLAFADQLQTDVKAITGQTSDVQIAWYSTAGWLANQDARAPTAGLLLEAAAQRSWLHVMHPVGFYNPVGVPYLGADIISWETSGVSPLHYSAGAHRFTGHSLGKWIYRGVFDGLGGSGWNGLRVTSLGQSGSNLTACFDTLSGTTLVKDTTTCPVHWRGVDGIEWHQDEVGAPTVTSVALSGSNCLNVGLSAPATDVASGRLEFGFLGETRISNNPPNGCRLTSGVVNPGSPGWTNWRDDDSVGAAFTDGLPSWNAVATQAVALTSGGVAAPADDSAAYFDPDDGTERILFGDDITPTTGLTVAFWAQHTTTTNAVVVRKWPEFQVRHQRGGTGTQKRYQVQFASGSDYSQWTTFPIEESAGATWQHIVMRYDGTQPLGARVTWTLDCVDVVDTELGTIPASLADSANVLEIGDATLAHADGLRDVVILDRAITDAEVLTMCRSRNAQAVLNLAPEIFVRPTCTDDPVAASGVVNLGTVSTLGAGSNLESDDFPQDVPGNCSAASDAGVPDTGPAVDSGVFDAGFATTLTNARSLACDGVDDVVEWSNPPWLDAETDVLICYVIRANATTAGDTPLGVWSSNNYQWRHWTRNGGARWYVPSGPTVASGYLGYEQASPRTGDEPIVPGPHQMLCQRYDLTQATASNRVRAWRDGVSVPLAALDTGPASVFSSPSGGAFSVCAGAGGTEYWAGEIDEVYIWRGSQSTLPTDTQIANEISTNVGRDDCTLPAPTYAGYATARHADVICRFEGDLTCTDEFGATLSTGVATGSPVFSTERACAGTLQNRTSLEIAQTGHTYETDTWTEVSGAVQMAGCVTYKCATSFINNVLIGQHDGTTTVQADDAWSLNIRNSGYRFIIEGGTDTTLDYREVTSGPIVTGVWQNVCWDVDLADSTTPIYLVHNGAAVTLSGSSGTLPTTFRYDATGKTVLGGTTGGSSAGWGGAGCRIDEVVVWRDQDTAPTRTQLLNEVSHDPATEPSPDYRTWGEPGCWFPLDGKLSDRSGNCADLVAGSGDPVTWPSPADPAVIPDAGFPDSGVSDAGFPDSGLGGFSQLAYAPTHGPDPSTCQAPVADVATGFTYYCDCQTGAAPGCVAGDDGTGAGTAASPYRTLGAAATEYGVSGKVALCRGGVWSVAANRTLGLGATCSSGDHCVFADYGDPALARPVLIEAGDTGIFTLGSSGGGDSDYHDIRNIAFKGIGGSSTQAALLLWNTDASDVMLDCLDISDFSGGLNINANGLAAARLTIQHSDLYDLGSQGVIGGVAGLAIERNRFVRVGPSSSTNHSIYVSAAANAVVRGNLFEPDSNCAGPVLTVHNGFISDILIEDNVLIGSGTPGNGCWGIGVDVPGTPGPDQNDRAIIRDNYLSNLGNRYIGVEGCIDCRVENNVIAAVTGGDGIYAPSGGRSANDAVNTRLIVQNNSIDTSGVCITLDTYGGSPTDGTGHIVRSNICQNASTGYVYGQAAADYATIDSNLCFGCTTTESGTGSGQDSNLSTTDPALASAPLDLRLTASSLAAIDQSNATAPTLDMLASIRYGPAPDRGAYEYVYDAGPADTGIHPDAAPTDTGIHPDAAADAGFPDADSGVWPDAAAGDTGPTTLLAVEGFEGAGEPAGWANAGSVDYDNTTAPLAGAEGMFVNSASQTAFSLDFSASIPGSYTYRQFDGLAAVNAATGNANVVLMYAEASAYTNPTTFTSDGVQLYANSDGTGGVTIECANAPNESGTAASVLTNNDAFTFRVRYNPTTGVGEAWVAADANGDGLPDTAYGTATVTVTCSVPGSAPVRAYWQYFDWGGQNPTLRLDNAILIAQ